MVLKEVERGAPYMSELDCLEAAFRYFDARARAGTITPKQESAWLELVEQLAQAEAAAPTRRQEWLELKRRYAEARAKRTA